jgi:hypothetical protein
MTYEALVMFVLLLVPLVVFALRGQVANLLLRSINLPKRSSVRSVGASLIPSLFAMFATLSAKEVPRSLSSMQVSVVGTLLVLLSFWFLRNRELMDFYVEPPHGARNDNFVFMGWGVTTALVCFVSEHRVPGLVFCFVTVLCTVKFRGKFLTYPPRAFIMLHQLLIVLTRDEPDFALYLATVRFLSAFDSRSFSGFAVESTNLTGFTLLVVSSSLDAFPMIMFGFMASFFAALACALTRESAHRLLALDADAQRFMDHAIKQKFGAPGSSCPGPPPAAAAVSPLTPPKPGLHMPLKTRWSWASSWGPQRTRCATRCGSAAADTTGA